MSPMDEWSRLLLLTTKFRIEATLFCSGMNRTGEHFAPLVTTRKLAEAIERFEAMSICAFREQYGDVLPQSLATLGEALREIARFINQTNVRLERLESMTKQELVELKNTLQSSNTSIAEIAGDVANLKNLADTNSAKVNDLQTKLADALKNAGVANDPELDAIVADLKNIADAQHNTLGNIAASVPGMPVGPGTPGDVPAPTPAPEPTPTPTPAPEPTPAPTPEPTPVTPAPVPTPDVPVTAPDVQAPGTVVTPAPTPEPAVDTNPATPGNTTV